MGVFLILSELVANEQSVKDLIIFRNKEKINIFRKFSNFFGLGGVWGAWAGRAVSAPCFFFFTKLKVFNT